MPVRVALNVVYAMLCEGCDAKGRQELDDQLHGWGEMNERGNRALMSGGGEG